MNPLQQKDFLIRRYKTFLTSIFNPRVWYKHSIWGINTIKNQENIKRTNMLAIWETAYDFMVVSNAWYFLFYPR